MKIYEASYVNFSFSWSNRMFSGNVDIQGNAKISMIMKISSSYLSSSYGTVTSSNTGFADGFNEKKAKE